MSNFASDDINHFDSLASQWWDPAGPLKTLHDINPVRLQFIRERVDLAGKSVLDIGCGGGILSESLAAQGATVTGIDMSFSVLNTAKLHLLESGFDIKYYQTTVEEFAHTHAESFDVITCMELLEHVPDPVSVIDAANRLLRPGGKVFFSTLNRNPKAYLYAIVGAEYVLKMLPKGTHDYKQFIRPSELSAWLRAAGLSLLDLKGMSYQWVNKNYYLSDDVSVNYLVMGG